ETLTCFKSADPGAVRATQLHGDHNDEGDLWSRDPNTSAPLPRCSSSSFSPLPFHCEVCLLEEVYMICDNLPAGTKLFLERPGTPFSTKESGKELHQNSGVKHGRSLCLLLGCGLYPGDSISSNSVLFCCSLSHTAPCW
ncbi:hypothetical protein GOODEAATRI_033936, partial [Goodea atripinnis]